MKIAPSNQIAIPSHSKTAAVLLLIAWAAGCGSSTSPTTGDAGPNDAGASGKAGVGGDKASLASADFKHRLLVRCAGRYARRVIIRGE